MRRGRRLDIVYLYVAVRLILFILFPHCTEDAYITFRAARNFLASGRPVFNLGEASWPASSPIWTAWSVLGVGMQISIEWWARIGSLIAEVFLIQAVGRVAGPAIKRNFAILIGLSQCAVVITTSGVEMWVMVAAFLWALEGSRAARVILACSRPEGLVLQFLTPWRKQQPWWLNLIAPAVWIVMGLLCGRWAPAGVTAKVGTYGLHLFGGWRWIEFFWPWWNEPDAPALGVLGLSAIVLAFWWWRSRPHKAEWIFVASGLLLVLAYWAAGSIYFFYYTTLPIAAACLLIARAAESLKLGWAVALLIALISWPFTTFPIKRWDKQYDDMSSLAYSLRDGDTCTLDAVGVTGWLLPHARFIDTIGLTSPRTEAERAKGDGWLERVILAEKPDWVVLLKAEASGNTPEAGASKMFNEPHFLARRYEITRTANDRTNPLLVLHRAEWAPAWHRGDPMYAMTPEVLLWGVRVPAADTLWIP